MSTPKVIVNGAFGKMGKVTVETINASPNYTLSAALGRSDNLTQEIQTHKPDIVIDFTNSESVFENAKLILDQKTHAVIGSSGLTDDQIKSLKHQCDADKLGAIIAPNFSLGAILMMQCAEKIAKHFNHVEIVETHHEQKLDAPSGTAIKTAALLQKARQSKPILKEGADVLPGSRGASCDDIPIHALRLPGFVASQQVVFGSLGENLSITHHSISRDCFMPGVLMALEKVQTLDHLVYGLEQFID